MVFRRRQTLTKKRVNRKNRNTRKRTGGSKTIEESSKDFFGPFEEEYETIFQEVFGDTPKEGDAISQTERLQKFHDKLTKAFRSKDFKNRYSLFGTKEHKDAKNVEFNNKYEYMIRRIEGFIADLKPEYDRLKNIEKAKEDRRQAAARKGTGANNRRGLYVM